VKRLLVGLGSIPVGALTRVSGDTWEFRFAPEYMQMPERPILGQVFEDNLARVHRSTLQLPPFFSNLLPEGALRELLARRAAVNDQREALLLAALGADLPGAVTVHGEGETEPDGAGEEIPVPGAGQESAVQPPLKFSLAGVQLKFSAVRQDDKLVIPVSGLGGHWIAKLPHREFPRIPENEFTVLQWARAAGIEVPDFDLVAISDIQGLPRELAFSEPWALVLRRFDRQEGGGRIHQEDFAQVLGLYPHEKYDKHNYETIARVTLAVAGPEAFSDLLRRFVFMVLSGNGDAHHKNWSFLYPDGRRARLSPAYDLVFTRAALPDDSLALNFGGSKDFSFVTHGTFRRLARKLELSEETVLGRVEEAAETIRSAWKQVEGGARLPPEVLKRLRDHLDAMHL
jgi:serine/threonine-protein kinase HipA